jgi:putative glycosyltransferase (TIGR04372 family)
MGATVEKPFRSENPRIIDYARSGKRSEFMDIYLGAHCAFCLTSGTGIDAIPYIFRRPMAFTNYVPVEYLQTFIPRSIGIWKHHYRDGKRMTFAEIIESGAGQFFRADQFAEAGITLVDNTPEEIRDVAVEMAWNLLHGANQDELFPQDEFWKAFPRSISPYNGKPIHGEIRMRIGREFLKGYL